VKTLIVEDSATLCAIYAQYLDGSGLEVDSVETLCAARDSLAKADAQLVLLDIELPDGSGLDLIDDLQQLSPQPAVVVMTGHGADYAEQAIARGADDFLNKPLDAARLRVTLLNAAEKQKLSQQVASLSVKRERLGSLRAQSPTMQTVFETVESLAGTVATAFVMGESGTGKELAARAIHQLSARAPWPFVVVDCSALGAEQWEQALFGTPESEGLIAEAAEGTLKMVKPTKNTHDQQRK
jgi:two-component system repressor protein LuxO